MYGLEAHLEIGHTVTLMVALDVAETAYMLCVVAAQVTVLSAKVSRHLDGVRVECVHYLDLVL